MKIEPCRKADS